MNPALAPGAPGTQSKWTVSSKSGIGTAPGIHNGLWFTLAEGIVTEIYYPYIDQANTRCLEFFITGNNQFSSERYDTNHETQTLEQGIPAYQIINTAKDQTYQLTKKIIVDIHGEVLLMKVQFKPLIGKLSDYHLYLYLNPLINNSIESNDAWVDNLKGQQLFFAKGGNTALSLGSTAPFKIQTCGYVGVSDGISDLKTKKRLESTYIKATQGNVGIMGEIDLQACNGEFLVALAFGRDAAEAGILAKSALKRNWDTILSEYIAFWKDSQKHFAKLGGKDKDLQALYRSSLMVLQVHSTKRIRGSMIASLSIPWGESKERQNIGGYHLIWPRDLVECAGAFIAADDIPSARHVLEYLIATQENDGHWAQCMWVNGTPYWSNVQMDETALPVLLADNLKRCKGLKDIDPWPMIEKATRYLIKNGPATRQDRWEENCGYTPFTLSAEIAALLAAADYYDEKGLNVSAQYIRETADIWNDNIEKWLYVSKNELAKQANVDGYYIRIKPVKTNDGQNTIPIRNRSIEYQKFLAENLLSTDVLALVRFGLRSPDDPRILNTLKLIDAMLKSETETGPVWHRFNQDGYGEHRDGTPYDGTGIGRGWPLLAGERAHYEAAKGNFEEAANLAKVICRQSNETNLIPEQIWDDRDIPEKGLFNGYATGSAMPLAWAHAEFIKLLRTLKDKKVFDTPPQTVERYLKNKICSPYTLWKFNHKIETMEVGKVLRIEVQAEAIVRWTEDDWKTWQESHTADTGLGIHHLDLPTAKLKAGTPIEFTFYWPESDHWEGPNFKCLIVDTIR